ncbi:MAG: FAD binding domain-containing protein [Bacillota bacterium]
MKGLSYYKAQSVEDVVDRLANLEGARILAGGTDLLLELERAGQGANLLDICFIDELRDISESAHEVLIGAACTFDQIERSGTVRTHARALSQAASTVGGPAIRNLATIGGNVANGAPAADSVPALIVLEARAKVRSAAGEREVEVEELVRAGRVHLDEGEIITRFVIPKCEGRKSAYVKLGLRRSMAVSRLSGAIGLSEAGMRFALGAVGPSACRIRSVEDILSQGVTCQDTVRRALSRLAGDIRERLGERPTAPYKQRAAQGVLLDLLSDVLDREVAVL